MYLSEGGGEGRIQPPVWLLRGGCVGIFTNLKTRWLVARHLAEDGSGMTDDRNAKDLRALLSSVEAAGWDYARIEIDGLTVVVSREDEALMETVSAPESRTTAPMSAPAAVAAAIAPAVESAAESTSAPTAIEVAGPITTVCSPSIGLYWRSPKPEAPPFVELGQAVTADDTVCIVEVMKLMTHVKAGQDGIVVRIHPANGDMVEFGSPLVDISPAQ